MAKTLHQRRAENPKDRRNHLSECAYAVYGGDYRCTCDDWYPDGDSG